ncbi:hypothetical protein DM01DRAFT_1337406 [Hesseltinella vesiculosa]|uniref:BAG domain-containing protein n=1 Tax=Hesseltinella vesiculosa TaxID=101127 RepID=A0A1X2GCK2_9FUNG|nr:hypothetical protein DM01DRAFT_1337406 [Hesseltinella vesiculosa]
MYQGPVWIQPATSLLSLDDYLSYRAWQQEQQARRQHALRLEQQRQRYMQMQRRRQQQRALATALLALQERAQRKRREQCLASHLEQLFASEELASEQPLDWTDLLQLVTRSSWEDHDQDEGDQDDDDGQDDDEREASDNELGSMVHDKDEEASPTNQVHALIPDPQETQEDMDEEQDDWVTLEQDHPLRSEKLHSLATLRHHLDDMTEQYHQQALAAHLAFDTLSDSEDSGSSLQVPASAHNREFLKYEDDIMRLLLQLDTIQSDGDQVVRDQRKAIVGLAEALLSDLDQHKLEEWERHSETSSQAGTPLSDHGHLTDSENDALSQDVDDQGFLILNL